MVMAKGFSVFFYKLECSGPSRGWDSDSLSSGTCTSERAGRLNPLCKIIS